MQKLRTEQKDKDSPWDDPRNQNARCIWPLWELLLLCQRVREWTTDRYTEKEQQQKWEITELKKIYMCTHTHTHSRKQLLRMVNRIIDTAWLHCKEHFQSYYEVNTDNLFYLKLQITTLWGWGKEKVCFGKRSCGGKRLDPYLLR